jgi:hypothetical protein
MKANLLINTALQCGERENDRTETVSTVSCVARCLGKTVETVFFIVTAPATRLKPGVNEI